MLTKLTDFLVAIKRWYGSLRQVKRAGRVREHARLPEPAPAWKAGSVNNYLLTAGFARELDVQSGLDVESPACLSRKPCQIFRFDSSFFGF